MDIAFYGSSNFSLRILEKLYEFHNKHLINLKYVVSQPAKPFGRKKVLTNNLVVDYCKNNNILVHTPSKLKELYDDSSIDLNVDISFVAAYGKILPKKILSTASNGFVNFHGSLLPKYRGAAPVQFTILNQDFNSAGVTIIKMDEGMDTGDIIITHNLDVTKDEFITMTSADLMELLANESAAILENQFNNIFNPKNWELTPQDHTQATYCYVSDMVKSNFEVKFDDLAKTAHGKIMSANPDPLAWALVNTKKGEIKINFIRSSLSDLDLAEISNIEKFSLTYDKMSKTLTLNLQNGRLQIIELQPEGKNIMSASDFANGYL